MDIIPGQPPRVILSKTGCLQSFNMDLVTDSDAAPNAVQLTVAAFLVDELLAPRLGCILAGKHGGCTQICPDLYQVVYPSKESQEFGKWTTPATEVEIAQATKNDFRRNCQMHFNSDIYYGNIIKGDLRSAISYVKQFPELTNLYNRFMDVYEHEQYMTYEVDAELNSILTAYQQYYRDAFYLCIGQEQAANKLRDRLAVLLGIKDNSIALCDMEQNQLVKLFMNCGLHFMGGKSSGYYGPYIWRITETVSYDVELPDGIRNYTVKLLDGFVTRSWIDYLSFGEIGPGGWADGDGYINCVKSAWDFESESFRVSLLKHEAQHARDLAMNKDMSSEDLEYRAKLVELIYSSERNLLLGFAQEADNSNKSNGHAMAAYRIVKGFADALGMDTVSPGGISVEYIQAIWNVV